MGSTGGCECMIPLQFALRRRMMMAGKDRQTWIYRNGKLLLPYHKFKNDVRDNILVTETPNFKMERVGYYDVAGVYFQVQINEKFVYNCIEMTDGNFYLNVSKTLNTTQSTDQKIYKGEKTVSIKEPGLYYIIFYLFGYGESITFSELFVI